MMKYDKKAKKHVLFKETSSNTLPPIHGQVPGRLRDTQIDPMITDLPVETPQCLHTTPSIYLEYAYYHCAGQKRGCKPQLFSAGSLVGPAVMSHAL